MKIPLAISAFLFLLSVSCKKSNEPTITPPVVTDTIKPPVIKVDTSTLLKSSWSYSYASSGTVITDSSNMNWKYDDQRRIIQQTDYAGSHVDTFTYTYLNDRYISDFHVYDNGSPQLISSAVYYQHVKNRTDSVILTSTGYGSEAGQKGTSSTYYYYNQAGQDSLERNFQNNTGQPQYITTINYYYTGTNLDSTTNRDTNGKLNDISYYSNGNHTVDNWYYSGIPGGVEHLSYTNIASGGLYVLFKNPNLLSETTSAPLPASTIYTETYSYQMDSANRVVAMSMSTGGAIFLKQVFTYY